MGFGEKVGWGELGWGRSVAGVALPHSPSSRPPVFPSSRPPVLPTAAREGNLSQRRKFPSFQC